MAISTTYAQTGRSSASQLHRPSGLARMTRLGVRPALFLLCLAAAFLAGCHHAASNSIAIQIDPSTAQSLDAGHSENFTATVAGDINARGVAWSLTLSGDTCTGTTAVNCGTLTNVTNTSVTYVAPVSLSSTETVTLTATSVLDRTTTGNVTINLQIPPQFTTTTIPPSATNGVPYTATIVAIDGVTPLKYSVVSGTLPAGLSLNANNGNIIGTPTFDGPAASQTSNFSVQVTDFNGVTALNPLALSITVAAPTAIQASAALPQGFTGATYSGQISATGGVPPLAYALVPGSGSLPPGLGINSTSGVISGLAAVDPAVTYPHTYSFTVQITDHAIPTQTFPLPASITISKPPVFQITTASLPNGTATQGYGALIQAKGGIPPYNWTLISGQLPAGLTLATQADNTALVSGTPILAGTDTFTVQVTDSDVNDAPLSMNFPITIVSGTSNNTLLSGSYAFFFQGYDTGGPVAVAGTLAADGKGNISSGFEDVNRASGVMSGAKLTGTYNVGLNGSDGRGTLHLIATPLVQNPLIVDYRLVLDSSGTFHLIEDNDTQTNTDSPNATHGVGVLKPLTQTVSGSSFSGNYAFQLSGVDLTTGRMAIGGVLHADGISKITPIVGDLNDAGKFAQLQSPSGSFTFDSTSGRGIAALLYEIAGQGQTQLGFAFYFASPSDIFFVETDINNTTQQFPRIAGEAVLQQTGVSFGNGSFAGKSVITGSGLDGGKGSVMAGLLTAAACDGSTHDASLSYDQNDAGAISTVAAAAASCSVAPIGRAVFNTLDPRLAVAYLTGPGQGLTLGSDAAVTIGLLEQQTAGPFGTATIEGSYALTTVAPADTSTSSAVGQLNSQPSPMLGTVDEVNAPGTPANLGQSAQLTVQTVDPILGRGTIQQSNGTVLPSSLIFYLLSPSQIRMISSDSNPGNGHPELLFLTH
jgi:hypothetical protein